MKHNFIHQSSFVLMIQLAASINVVAMTEGGQHEMRELDPTRKRTQNYFLRTGLANSRPSFDLSLSSSEPSARSSFNSTHSETTQNDGIPSHDFPHYNPNLAKIYQRTLNTSDYVQKTLIDVANADTAISITAIGITATDVSLHSIIDTVNYLIHGYSKKLVKKSTDNLYILHINGLRFIGQEALRIAIQKGDMNKAKILTDHHVHMNFTVHDEDESGHIREISFNELAQQKGVHGHN